MNKNNEDGAEDDEDFSDESTKDDHSTTANRTSKKINNKRKGSFTVENPSLLVNSEGKEVISKDDKKGDETKTTMKVKRTRKHHVLDLKMI